MRYRVAIVGVGMVGAEMLRVLRQREFPISELKVLARTARTETIAGEKVQVEVTTPDKFKDVDFAFFAGTEGEKGASQLYGWQAVEMGCIVIDNGDDYRMDPRAPLVVPEVNADALKSHQGFIANPNCSTIQMVVALAPLHRAAGIKRIVVSSYQAVSGTGKAAVEELLAQAPCVLEGTEVVRSVYPKQIAFNVFPHIGSFKGENQGYSTEEIKMVKETRKILGDPDIAVCATCVRVPVMNGHSEVVNVEFRKDLTPEDAARLLSGAPGVVVMDDPAKAIYPTPFEASGGDEVFVGRIRRDPSAKNALALWVVSDNIRKGAALNAVQIAEKMIEMGLVKR